MFFSVAEDAEERMIKIRDAGKMGYQGAPGIATRTACR